MMDVYVNKIIEWLIVNKAIESEDKELYRYALHSIWITISPLFIVLILGTCMGVLLEGIVMIVPFMCIRKYSGGYHAKNVIICLVSSCLVLFFCLYLSLNISYEEWISRLTFFCACCLVIFSPVDSSNRKLDKIEKKMCRQKVFFITTIFTGVHIMFLLMGKDNFSISISMGLIISAGLQLPYAYERFKKVIYEK